MATAPSCQFSPFMKNNVEAQKAPAHAKPAMCHFLRGDTSTIAPTIGRMNALRIVAKLVR